MNELTTPTQDITPVVKDRRAAWNEMATTPINNSDDLYATIKPAASDDGIVYDTQNKVGIGSAFIKGLPNDLESSQTFDPNYKPTFGESLASGLTDFARSGTKVGVELFDKNTKEARVALDTLRRTDPNMADQIESQTIGAKMTNAQLATKGTAAIAEGVLSFLPFFKAGRVALTAAEVGSLGKLGVVGEKVLASPILSKLYSGGLNGALYGGLYGLHKYDGDWSEAAKGAAFGGLTGGALMGLGSSLAFAGRYGGQKALQGFKFVGGFAGDALDKVSEHIPAKWYSTVFSVDSTLKKYYGDIGENFVSMFKGASKEATKDLGTVQMGLIDNGLIKPPTGFGKVANGVEFVGDNADLMTQYNRVLRGMGAYADPVVRTAAIEADSRLQFLDGLRKTYGATAQREGIVDSLLNLDTYLPKHTPVVEGTNKMRTSLEGATTQAERESIYAANDPMVKEMVENSVFHEKAFPTLEDAYKAYYDYADIVSGGSHTPIGDNKFLQKMVADGEAKTLEEAKGKVIEDLKFRKKSLTPQAGSLDFKRKVNLPWYDPNPSRVMPQYAFDASMRISMAQKFGANDEVLHQMLGSIKDDLTRGVKADEAAKTFEKFVRTVTGQIERTPGEEKASAFVRSLQVPKLAFAQIINLGQSLNTLLSSDFGSTMKGLTTAFKEQSMRDTIERGVLTNSFIRQVFDYNSGGTQLAEKLLKYSGFTYTEMFNRAVGSVAADTWGGKNLQKLFKDYGISELSEGEQKSVSKMIADKAAMQKESLMEGVKVQGEMFDKFRQMFPDEEFTATAGNLGAARKRLDTLESSIGEKTAKLQKAKAILEKELLAKSEPLTAKETEDLRVTIDALRGEISASEGIHIGEKNPTPAVEYTPEQKKAALDGVVALKRAKLEDVITRLESKFDESRAIGDTRDVITMHSEASKTPESLDNFVTRVHGEIGNIDSAIISLQNELADKQSVLEAAIDSYKISDERALKNNPNGVAYDAHLAGKKTATSDALSRIQKEQPREYWALKELGVPIDDVIARGFMTPEEKAIAAQTFVEKTQFLGHPIDLPYFSSSPTGKVLFQFKTFAYQQARFITNEMKNQIERKDYSRFARNLFILSTVFPMTGEVLADVRSLVTQEKRPTQALDRYISDIFSAGTYGMFYDFYKSAESGKTADFFAGATIGDAIRYLEDIPKTINNPSSGLKDFTKNILRQTGVGRPAVNVLFPPTGAGKSTLESMRSWSAD